MRRTPGTLVGWGPRTRPALNLTLGNADFRQPRSNALRFKLAYIQTAEQTGSNLTNFPRGTRGAALPKSNGHKDMQILRLSGVQAALLQCEPQYTIRPAQLHNTLKL